MAVKIVIDIPETRQEPSNNRTSVTVKVNAVWDNYSYNLTNKPGWVKIDGTTHTFNAPFNENKTQSGSCNLYTITKYINHNTDGTKRLELSASYTSGVSSGTVGASASVELPTIDRVPKITLTGTNALGEQQSISVTKHNSRYLVTLTYSCGETTVTLLSKTTTSTVTFTPSTDLARYNTTGDQVTIRYTATTFTDSGEKVGTTAIRVNYKIPASVVPRCSVSVVDGAGLSGTYGGFIQGRSTFKITVGAEGIYGSTVRSYKVTANGSTYSSKNVTTDPIRNAGNNEITVEVTDSRSRKTTVTETINVIAYSPPKITDMKVARVGDNNVQLTCSYHVTPLQSSSATIVIQYKKTTEAAYQEKRVSGSSGTVNGYTYQFEADSNSSYDVILTVSDPFTSVSRNRVAPSASRLFSIHKKGNGWAFGKRAEVENAIDFAWQTIHRNSAYFDTNMKIYGKTVDGKYKNIFEPVNDNGNTVIGYGNYDAASGNTNIYGHDVWFGVSDIASPGMHRPYLRRGDEFNVTIQTAGYVTNSKRDISFMVPLNMPIIGGPTITASSVNGFVFRQGGHYVYGSSSSVSVHPTSYDCAGAFRYGIRVTVHFPVGEDADVDEELNEAAITNNDVIGIYWSGKIKLS